MLVLPVELASLRQFCCRDGKQPVTCRPTTGNLTSRWADPETWMSLDDANKALAVGKKYRRENKDNPGEWLDIPVDGIGFITAKSEDPTKQIIGGDLDACRDPITGQLSSFAMRFLQDTQPFYTEISPSKCGIRMFYLGHLPNRVNKFFVYGPDDLSDETKHRIADAKPGLKKKIEDGKAHWNGLELYEAGHHLTLTGLDAERFEVVDRSTAIMIALAPLIKNAKIPGIPWVDDMAKYSASKRLPKLSILDVINTTGWEESGGQLFGPHPTKGSTTGRNLVVNPSENTYCWMHNGINAGGDAWVWLAHECGAVSWETRGEGLLRDPEIRDKTITHAIKRGFINLGDVLTYTPTAAFLSLDDVTILQGDGDKAVHKFSPTKAATILLKVLKLAKAKGGDSRDPIYYYNGQIFVPDGERIINNILNKAAGDLATIRNKKETVTKLHDFLLSYAVTFDPDPFLLGVRNGVVDMKTGDYRSYSPEDLMTDQIQVTYDKDATCPKFLQFLKEVAPNEIDQCTLVDWFAIHSIKLMFPYIMFLNGLGRNGKGIYERVMKRFFGEDAFCGMALEELTLKNNRFAGADLAGKRGQIVSEAGEESHRGKRKIPTSFMKNSTGDGIIDSDRKNKSRVKFKPFHATTVDSNDMPLIDDMSKGWIERFCKVDMPFHYVDNPDPANWMERKKDPHLFEKLTEESELSGILNLLIERTTKLSTTMTITKRPSEEMFAEYLKQSNSIRTFLEMYCDYEEMGGIGKDVFLDTVYDAYKTWCEIVVCDKVDIQRFGGAVKKMCGNRTPERVHVDDHKKRIYRGLRFDANRYQALLDHYRPLMDH